MKGLFGNKDINNFEVIYKGPSFKNNAYDIDLLYKQLESLDRLIRKSLKQEKLDESGFERKIRFKRGSLIEEIILISQNPTAAIAIGSTIGGTISGLLVHYLTNKNKTSKKLKDQENMVAPLNTPGDSININVYGGAPTTSFCHMTKKINI